LITCLPAQYARIRRLAAAFLASFTFEGNRRTYISLKLLRGWQPSGGKAGGTSAKLDRHLS
jgi:hypothetical protein